MADAASAPIPANQVLFQEMVTGDEVVKIGADDHRRLIGAAFGEPGRVRPSDLLLSQHAEGAARSLDVSAGAVIVASPKADRPYLVYLADRVVVDLNPLNWTVAATRTHKVWLAVYDRFELGTGYGAKIVVTEDTGSGAGAPTDAAGYYQLGVVTINPGQVVVSNANLSNLTSAPAPNWPRAHAYMNFAYTFPSTGTVQILSRMSSVLTGGMSMPTAKHVKVPATGFYRVSALARVNGAAAGGAAGDVFKLTVRLNAADNVAAGLVIAASFKSWENANGHCAIPTRLVSLNSGDTVALMLEGIEGGFVDSGAEQTYLTVELA